MPPPPRSTRVPRGKQAILHHPLVSRLSRPVVPSHGRPRALRKGLHRGRQSPAGAPARWAAAGTNSYKTWGANRGRIAGSGRRRPLMAGQSKIRSDPHFRWSWAKIVLPRECARRDSNPQPSDP
jgi:hypothetical protein